MMLQKTNFRGDLHLKECGYQLACVINIPRCLSSKGRGKKNNFEGCLFWPLEGLEGGNVNLLECHKGVGRHVMCGHVSGVRNCANSQHGVLS